MRDDDAIALRPPAALADAPSFYPECHARPLPMVSVAFGGAAAGLVLGSLGSLVLGPAGVMLGFIAFPVGHYGARWMFERRGQAELERALALRARDPDSARAHLEALLESPRPLPEVKVEAAFRLALDALERGDLSRAIARLDFDPGDHHLQRRRRSWEYGARGEALRSILASLSPGSLRGGGVGAAQDFPEPRESLDGAAMLAMLRLLEAAAEDDDGRVAGAWQDVHGGTLRDLSPALELIALAVASRRLPELADDLFDRLRDDDDGQQRALLRRLFPRMALPGEAGYRGVSHDVDVHPLDDGAHLDAPAELTALARMPEHGMARLPRGSVAATFAGGLMTTVGIGIIIGAAVGGPAGAAAGATMASFVCMYGAAIPIVLMSRRVQMREQAHRVAPLLALDPVPPRSWLVEMAAGPPGRVEKNSGYRRLTELPASQMVLYVACARAEQAIEDGEVGRAWDAVSWWFAGVGAHLPNPDPMYAVGSSLIRVATLSGHLVEAQRLTELVTPSDHGWDGPRRRTCRGNASRALELARALLAARMGHWELAVSHLAAATRHRAVHLEPHEASLYAAIDARARARGIASKLTQRQPAPEHGPWLDRVFPER